jgi:hypothetical protein
MNIGYGKRWQKKYRPTAKMGVKLYSIHHGAVLRNRGWSSLMGSQKHPKRARAPARDSQKYFITLLLLSNYIRFSHI